MATATALYPTEKSKSNSNSSKKPGRTMTTFPPLKPQARRPTRAKPGEPFDPEELTRRLTSHLLEQRKIKAEKRREARAAAAAKVAAAAAAAAAATADVAKHDDVAYHHVPRVAASAFEKTATQDTNRVVHKLSESVLRARAQREADDAKADKGVPNLQTTQAADRHLLERLQAIGRNQFQWNPSLEVAHEEDLERGLYEPPQRTFHSDFLRAAHTRSPSRPSSTVDGVWDKLDLPRPKTRGLAPHHGDNDRNDWVQHDDDTTTKKKDRTAPFLRKMESSWTLMTRKPKASSNRDEAVAGISDLDSPPEIKQGFTFRGSILAKLRKYSS